MEQCPQTSGGKLFPKENSNPEKQKGSVKYEGKMKTYSEMQILKTVSSVHLLMGNYQMSSTKMGCKPRSSKAHDAEKWRTRFTRETEETSQLPNPRLTGPHYRVAGSGRDCCFSLSAT